MIIMAVDLGLARTGLALCDKNEMLASPLGIIEEKNPAQLLVKVAQKAREHQAALVVVGLPRNMDGTEGASAQKAREFARFLYTLTGVPVDMRDERGTTVTAHGYLNQTDTRGKKRKAVVDSVAATIILQDYLDYRRLHIKNEENTGAL